MTRLLAATVLVATVLGAGAVDITNNTYLTSPHALNKHPMEPFAERVTKMCKNAVQTLADMKAKAVRATAAWGVMFKEMGMVPVNISSGAPDEALQRGQIDCSSGADARLKSYTLRDVANDVLDDPMGPQHGTVVFSMNADTWASLSEGAHKVIQKGLPQLAADSAFGHEEEKAAARAGAAEKAGLKDVRASVTGDLKTVAKWETIVADSTRDKRADIDALDREIYSKVKFR